MVCNMAFAKGLVHDSAKVKIGGWKMKFLRSDLVPNGRGVGAIIPLNCLLVVLVKRSQ